MAHTLDVFIGNVRIKTYNFKTVAFFLIKNLVLYPLTMCGDLIKMGYIPTELFVTKWEVCQIVYEVPSRIEVVKSVFNAEGLYGLMRGVWHSMISSLVYDNTLSIVYEFFDNDYRNHLDRSPVDRYKFHLLKVITAQIIAVILSQPFVVSSTLQVGQYVGKENLYSGLSETFIHVIKYKGIGGFLSGILPRLVHKVCLQVIVDTACIFIGMFLGDKDVIDINVAQQENELYSLLVRYRRLIISLARLIIVIPLGGLIAPLEVLEKTCIVANSRLALGNTPFNVINENQTWFNSIKLLANTGHLSRATNMNSKMYTTNPNLFSTLLINPLHCK